MLAAGQTSPRWGESELPRLFDIRNENNRRLLAHSYMSRLIAERRWLELQIQDMTRMIAGEEQKIVLAVLQRQLDWFDHEHDAAKKLYYRKEVNGVV